MYSVLLDLQRVDRLYYYPSLKDFRKFTNQKALKNLNLSLAKPFLNFPTNTNIHSTDLRSTYSFYNNVWINGIFKEPIFVLQDYGNDSFFTKWGNIVFDSKDLEEFSIGLTKKNIYLISPRYLIQLGPHYLTKNEISDIVNNLNTKRPFDILWRNRNSMIIKLKSNSEDYIIGVETKLK